MARGQLQVWGKGYPWGHKLDWVYPSPNSEHLQVYLHRGVTMLYLRMLGTPELPIWGAGEPSHEGATGWGC